MATGGGPTRDELLAFLDFTKPLPKIKNYAPVSKPCSSVARRAMLEREKKKDVNIDSETFKQDPYYMDPRESGQFVPGVDDSEYSNDFRRRNVRNESFQAFTSVFEQYDFDNNTTPHLPIAVHRDTILKTIESHSVTIIQGSTGSGKSTQVPQYILEAHARKNLHCNIMCTQPRRIAAMSVAKFVSECRGWRLGSLVGYQIAMDKVTSEDTRLTFVTTGVLLMKLVTEKNMNQYTHIILDEVCLHCM